MVAMHPDKPWLWGPLSGLGIGVATATLVIDQLHKWWMLKVFEIEGRGRVTVTSFLDFEYVKNTGVSYGLFLQESRQGQWILVGFAALAIGAMAVWLARGVSSRLVALSLGLIMGGAASNAIDRLTLREVGRCFALPALGFPWY